MHVLGHCKGEGGDVVSIGVGSTSRALKTFGEVGGRGLGLVWSCGVVPGSPSGHSSIIFWFWGLLMRSRSSGSVAALG